jgi:DNA-binding NarL/FixJ family response regulator
MLGVGIAGFVLKRAVAMDMIPAVAEVLRGGVYVSPSLQTPPPGSVKQEPT